ncbi:hypothetical protein HDU89_004728 [Geranomyces variabilis]|nr:hypothetical protein HDU89_004728 [Geranomyces variabilis]
MSEEIIYVLGLENDCYYVGKSKTPKDQIQQHFSGIGSAWTWLHRPVCVVETQAATTENSEDSLTQRYIRKCGIDRVRGGWFHMPNPSKEEVKVMDRMIRSVTGDCFLRGGPGHFAAQCPGFSRSAAEPLERSCQQGTDTGLPTHAQIRSLKPLHAQIRSPKTLHAGVAGGMDIIKQRAMRADIKTETDSREGQQQTDVIERWKPCARLVNTMLYSSKA